MAEEKKDPAFLLYSKDFFEGTRTMLPEERACLLDLMIYQHQNGLIPLDLKRVLLYCSGIDKATLEATLEAKFKKTDKGWYNEKLKRVICERANYTSKQSENGQIGQIFKKSKKLTDEKGLENLKNYIYNHLGKQKTLEFLKTNTLQGLLEASLQHLANEDVIVNEDINEDINENKEEVKKEKFNFKKSLLEKGADEKLVDDWMTVRNKQKAVNTETALKGFIREVEKSNFNIDQILKKCVEKSWRGFEAKWMENENNHTQQKKGIPKVSMNI